MSRHGVLVAIVAVCACGKSPKEAPPAEAKVAETTAPAKPASAPVKAASRGPEHAVYSLVDNRLSAHLRRGGGLVVDAGSAGFAKYTRIANQLKGGKRAWELRQTENDLKVARLTGKSGTVFVPLTAAEAGRNTVRLRAFSKDDATISLRVNDNKDINGQLGKGWTTVDLAVPAGQLKEGENALTLFSKASGLELAWLQIGAQTPARCKDCEDDG